MGKNKPYIIYFIKILPMFLAVYWLLMPLLNGVLYGFDDTISQTIIKHIVSTPVGILAVFIALAALFTYRKIGKQSDK